MLRNGVNWRDATAAHLVRACAAVRRWFETTAKSLPPLICFALIIAGMIYAFSWLVIVLGMASNGSVVIAAGEVASIMFYGVNSIVMVPTIIYCVCVVVTSGYDREERSCGIYGGTIVAVLFSFVMYSYYCSVSFLSWSQRFATFLSENTSTFEKIRDNATVEDTSIPLPSGFVLAVEWSDSLGRWIVSPILCPWHDIAAQEPIDITMIALVQHGETNYSDKQGVFHSSTVECSLAILNDTPKVVRWETFSNTDSTAYGAPKSSPMSFAPNGKVRDWILNSVRYQEEEADGLRIRKERVESRFLVHLLGAMVASVSCGGFFIAALGPRLAKWRIPSGVAACIFGFLTVYCLLTSLSSDQERQALQNQIDSHLTQGQGSQIQTNESSL